MCWTECPMAYPVRCGLECIPQSESCAMEAIDKITAVGSVVVNAATIGLFGTVAKQIVPGVKCGLQLFTVTKSLIKLIGETNDAPTAKDKIKALLANSDVAKTDLPVAIATCLGLPAAKAASNDAMRIASSFLDKFVTKKTGGTKTNLLDQTQFLNLAREAGIATVAEPETKKALMGMIEDGLSVASASGPCGSGIKTLIDKIQDLVVSVRQKTPKATAEKVKEVVMGTDIMIKSVPDVAEKCIMPRCRTL